MAELPAALSAIDEHRFTVEDRAAVGTAMPDGTAVTAFNDIAVVRVPGHRLAAVEISVQGRPFVRYAADAVIVATPTGSTAYSFSAGGPIVSPNVDGVLVAAAAAHSSFNRALLLSPNEEVTLRVLPASGLLAVEVDGIVAGHVSAGDTLPIASARSAARVVRLGVTTFYTYVSPESTHAPGRGRSSRWQPARSTIAGPVRPGGWSTGSPRVDQRHRIG